MEVDLAVLADAANTTESGKINILGIFDRFTLGPEFPASSPTFSIVVRIVGHPSETGTHQLLLQLADADGREIAKFGGEFTAERKKTTAKPFRVPVILGAQVNFPHPGEYSVDVLVDERWETSIRLEVRKASS